MTQVIIYTNSTGNVSVCVPTGELPIEEVLTKDCPEGAIVVNGSSLPQGHDNAFFDAWVLNGATVSVDINKAKKIQLVNLNNIARIEAQHRFNNDSIGIDNKISDADWKALVQQSRLDIDEAQDTSGLVAAIVPVSNAIEANK